MKIVQCDRCPAQAGYVSEPGSLFLPETLNHWHLADPWLGRDRPLATVDLCPKCFAEARIEDVFDFDPQVVVAA